MRTAILIVAATVMLASCSHPVVMQDPKTGDMAQCHTEGTQWGLIGQHYDIKSCVEQYQRAGWQRMSDRE